MAFLPGEQSDKSPVLWVTGYPGCGKTAVGDFLARYHGFTHIDVDAHFMMPRKASDPEDPLIKGYMKHWQDLFAQNSPDPVLSEEDYGPFLRDLVCARVGSVRAEERGGRAARIVITQGMHRPGRDFVRRTLAGLDEEVLFLGLKASMSTKIARMRAKMERWVPISTKGAETFAEQFEKQTGKPLTDEAYAEHWKEENAQRIPHILNAFDVDEEEDRDGGGNSRDRNIDIDKRADVFAEVSRLMGLEERRLADADVAEIFNLNWKKLEEALPNGEK